MKHVDYISADMQSVITATGDKFVVGETVGHQDTGVGTSEITGFAVDFEKEEIEAVTTGGLLTHLPFLVKLR